MKTKIILSSAALAALFILSCSNGAKKDSPAVTEKAASTTAALYTCPMHPNVKSDKPAQCPDCGMDLELVAKTDSAAH